MSDTRLIVTAITKGALLVAVPVAIASLAPVANDQFISPVDGRILTIAWWFMTPLGTALAVMGSRRMWPGTVIAALSVVGFHLSLVLLLPVADRGAAFADLSAWATAVAAVAIPWGLGMILGVNAMEGRPRRLDGASSGPEV